MNTEYKTINPTTGDVLKSYSTLTKNELFDNLNNAKNQQKIWEKTDILIRVKCIEKLAVILQRDIEKFANIMANEMGKPLIQGISEIEKCISQCDYYAKNLEKYMAPEPLNLDDVEAYRFFEPIGVIYAIMPWNFPFWQVLRCVIPNLGAGNAVVLKHAENVIGSAQMIVEAVNEAGFPENLFQNLVIDLSLSNDIINHKAIQGITLTGSNRAGKAVGSAAGNAMKKVVLELGGSDPYVILADSDVSLAAQACVSARLLNAGQICVSPKRIIVDKSIKNQLVKEILKLAQKFKTGNPLSESTKMGPMAREDLRLQLDCQVQNSIKAGAKCILGGQMPQGKGYFYPATILTNVNPGMPAFDEELFGPVIAIIEAENEKEAIRLANETDFGLGGAVFTADIEKGLHIASKEIKSGMCNVNRTISSDSRIPFGGIKLSGFGREVAIEGIREFVNVKSVVVNRAVKK